MGPLSGEEGLLECASAYIGCAHSNSESVASVAIYDPQAMLDRVMNVLEEVPSRIQTFFFISLFGWVAAYIFHFSRGGKQAFAKNLFLHDFHAVAVCILASMSIFFNDEAVFSEFTTLSFTLSYFIVDFVDCVIRRDIPFFIHALLSLITMVGCGLNPIHRSNRSGSRGAMTELSTYSLHKWQKTKSKTDFIIFFVLFTACRIIWIPYFMWGIYSDSGLDFQMVGGSCIFLLNLFWWFKMVSILRNYEERPKQFKSPENEKKGQ
jgi:hypothetical protein